MKRIASGENPEMLREIAASYVGVGYWERLETVGDFELQVILRNLDNETLTAALCGATGKIVVRFLGNLSDRLLYFISEDIDHWKGTEEEILKAQRQVLSVGGCFLTE